MALVEMVKEYEKRRNLVIETILNIECIKCIFETNLKSIGTDKKLCVQFPNWENDEGGVI
jgi:hypothetical protein